MPYTGTVGSIAGAVTRNDTGDPVPYATLYTNGYEFGHVSLYDGLYEIHDVPTGNYTLAFQKVGYAGASQSITVSTNQTTTANFSVTYTGKTMEEIYWIDTFAGNANCDGCNLYASYHTQSFKTGPDTGFIKYAACKPNIDGITMKFTILSGSSTGTQIGDPVYGTLEAGVGGNMIGAEWADGDEPAVSPNTTYWLRFERNDATGVYCYAADDNPYSDGQNGLNSGWDYYGCIRSLTESVNTVNTLQAERASGGSSSKVNVYDVSASTSYTLSVYIRCPSDGGTYWAECAYRLGDNSAQNFDQDSGSWTMVKKFDSGGTNGNGDVWTLYTANISTGGYTQISVGFKLGSSGGTGPTVQWDTLQIE